MTTVATVQAENLTSATGGARVITDPAASGGKALLVDSAVTVRTTVALTAPASVLRVRARTDATAAIMVVAIDGLPFTAATVRAQTWTSYDFYPTTLKAGQHTVTIKFTNPDARNLLLDVLTLANNATPSSETRLTAYLTGYGYPDNDPAYSDAIAHPTATRPAAGGSGTYADPTTMAVGFVASLPDLPYGTIFYVPALRRYFRIEDLCGACHGSPRPARTAIWLDCWVGGKGRTPAYVDSVAAALTGPHTVIRNPSPGYVVADGELAVTGVHLYGETPVLA